MQYRKGTFTNAAVPVAQTLNLGFIPDHISVYSYTSWGTNSSTLKAEWFQGMPNASALLTTRGTTTLSTTLQASNGFTPFSAGGVWAPTVKTITGATAANPVVITCTSHGFSTGDIITISSVVGMVQLNTNRYKVVVVNANSFSLQDLFGNAVDGTAYGTYVSGGQANLISSVTTSPVGLQQDSGATGITIGTAAVGNANDVMYWEAFYATPTGW